MRYCRLIVLVLRDAEIIRLAHSVNVALPQLLMINHSQTHAHIEKKNRLFVRYHAVSVARFNLSISRYIFVWPDKLLSPYALDANGRSE